jgi:predicted HD phosphohydrolase
VVFDATNVSAKHRMGLLGKLPACVERTAMVHVVAPHMLLARNKLRERKVPGDVIWRQIRRFEYPTLGEQFDAIYPFIDSHNVLGIDQILDSMFKFDQDNPHHRFSLGEHSYRAAEYMATVSKNHNLTMAALLHDVGKLYTKTYKNHKGEPTEGAHYYSHGNVSGYLSQLIKHDLPKEQLKKYPLAAHLSQKIINWEYVAKLTNYHMQPYFSKTEKSINRWKRRLGADLWEDLLLLHEADKFAH